MLTCSLRLRRADKAPFACWKARLLLLFRGGRDLKVTYQIVSYTLPSHFHLPAPSPSSLQPHFIWFMLSFISKHVTGGMWAVTISNTFVVVCMYVHVAYFHGHLWKGALWFWNNIALFKILVSKTKTLSNSHHSSVLAGGSGVVTVIIYINIIITVINRESNYRFSVFKAQRGWTVLRLCCFIISTSTRELMLSVRLVCWFIRQQDNGKNYQPDCHETWPKKKHFGADLNHGVDVQIILHFR